MPRLKILLSNFRALRSVGSPEMDAMMPCGLRIWNDFSRLSPPSVSNTPSKSLSTSEKSCSL